MSKYLQCKASSSSLHEILEQGVYISHVWISVSAILKKSSTIIVIKSSWQLLYSLWYQGDIHSKLFAKEETKLLYHIYQIDWQDRGTEDHHSQIAIGSVQIWVWPVWRILLEKQSCIPQNTFGLHVSPTESSALTYYREVEHPRWTFSAAQTLCHLPLPYSTPSPLSKWLFFSAFEFPKHPAQGSKGSICPELRILK